MIEVETELVLELLGLHKEHIFINSNCIDVSSEVSGLFLWDTFPWQIIHHNNLSTLFALTNISYLTLRSQLIKLQLVKDLP